MQTLIVILVLLILTLVVYGFVVIWMKLNERCIERYGYKPMNSWNLILGSFAMICIGVGSAMVSELEPGKTGGFEAIKEFMAAPTVPKIDLSLPSLDEIERNLDFWESTEGNGLVIRAIGLLVGGIIFLRISYKTSLFSGIVASILLAVIGTLFFLVLIIVIAGLFCAAENSKRKVVVVSRY